MLARTRKDPDGCKLLTLDDACARYSLGETNMRRIMNESGAVVRIGRLLRADKDVLDAYFESLLESRSNLQIIS